MILFSVFAVLTIQFSNSTFSGLESSGNISVTLILKGGTSDSIISVIVQPFDQSLVSAQGKIWCPILIDLSVYCSGNEVDYTSAPINATFPVGSTSTTVVVPVSKDNILEERETFNLNFSIPSSLNGQIVPGNITTATGIVVDDTSKNKLLETLEWIYIPFVRCYCKIWSGNVHYWWKWWSGTSFIDSQ